MLWTAGDDARADQLPHETTTSSRPLEGPIVMSQTEQPASTPTIFSRATTTATAETGPKSKKATRKEKKRSTTPPDASPADASALVTQPSVPKTAEEVENAQVQELVEMDDWSSAWADVKATGERWGGRGKGGRGIQRNTVQPKDVFVEGVTLAYMGNDLLSRTTLRLSHGHRYGIVGKNGVGKTTLLRRIATQTLPGFPLHLRCFLVRQEVSFPSDKSQRESSTLFNYL